MNRATQDEGTAAWLRRGLVFAGACSLAFAGIAYFRGLHRFQAPFLHVWAWQAAAWLPWAGVFTVRRRTLDWCLRESNRELLALRLALGGAATGLVGAVWLRLVSERLSPFLGAPDTNMGVFRFFFIFWFLLQGLLFALVVAWRMLGALPLPAAAARREADEGAPPAERSDAAGAGWLEGRLVVGPGKGAEVLDLAQVVWIESQDYYAVVHVQGGPPRWLRRSLSDLAAELESRDFVRVHRSSLINLRFLREVERPGFVVLSDGTRCRVSRSGLKTLDTVLGQKP